MNVIAPDRSGLRGTARAMLARLARGFLDALYPPLCFSCHRPVAEPHNLCAACWKKIEFLDGGSCARCGIPFEVDPGEGTVCAACHAQEPAFDRARSVMRYEAESRDLVLAFKRGDRLDMAPGFARWLERAGRDLIEDAEVILAVPLHRWRLWHRRYNQAALLALHLAQRTGKRFEPLALVRTRATSSQGAMPSAKARRRNVRAAFRVPPSCRPIVDGRRVLLIDDVMTTGATADACARALKRAGAAEVRVLSLARVVRPLADPI